MTFFTSSSNTMNRSSSGRSSRQRTRARYTYVANRPTHTRGLGDSGNDVFWQRGYQSYCFLLLKSRGGRAGFACKKISAKKDRPPARKNLSHVSRSRDLFVCPYYSLPRRCAEFFERECFTNLDTLTRIAYVRARKCRSGEVRD